MKTFRQILFSGFLLLAATAFSQNLLSPVWNLSFVDENTTIVNETGQVNLLLSWERQNYSWMSNTVELSQEFTVSKEFTQADFDLELSLQCNVIDVVVNGTRLGGGIPNSFWNDRGRTTAFNVKNALLKRGNNTITIKANDLSYTGGKSYNECRLVPRQVKLKSSISIDIPAVDHTFFDSNIVLTLKTESPKAGSIQFVLRNSYQDTLVAKTIKTAHGEQTHKINLSENKLDPGFYECIAILNTTTYAGDVKWLCVSPEQLPCDNAVVDNFKAYWDKAKAELKTIKPDFKMQKLAHKCTDTKDVYIVSMQSLGDITVSAYYIVPTAAGPHPVVMHVPGYDYDFDENNIQWMIDRDKPVAELAMCIRGHGLSLASFDPWDEISFWGYKICDMDENVYRGAYMDCVRAIEFLKTRAEIDPKRIGVAGGSQGGGLALATAGLCANDINACGFFDPFPCDTRDHFRIRKMVKPELQRFLDNPMNPCTFDELLSVQDYVDAKGFAPMITCPVLFVTALFDDDIPPHMGFAAYNLITAPKTYKVYPNDSHLGESGEYSLIGDFCMQQFGF